MYEAARPSPPRSEDSRYFSERRADIHVRQGHAANRAIKRTLFERQRIAERGNKMRARKESLCLPERVEIKINSYYEILFGNISQTASVPTSDINYTIH